MKDKIEITYSDMELSLRLPVPLLWPRGTLSLPDDGPRGVAPRSAGALGAVRPRVSALAVDTLLPADVTDPDVHPPVAVAGSVVIPPGGVGDSLPAAGVGAFRPAAGMGNLLSAPARAPSQAPLA